MHRRRIAATAALAMSMATLSPVAAHADAASMTTAVYGDGSIKLKAAGVGSIPADLTAVDPNLTALDATGNGSIQANTGTKTGTSNLNHQAGSAFSNSVIAQVGSDGRVTQTAANLALTQAQSVTNGGAGSYLASVYNGSGSQPVDAPLDALGYFIEG